MKIHTGENPYQCIHCSNCFLQRHNLNRHMRTHTEDAIAFESSDEIVKSQTSEKTPVSSNTGKRGLSISPEIGKADKTSISNNNLNKKNKN